jgi:cobalt/nickel transport system permease protein
MTEPMTWTILTPLLAVHISDGILSVPWQAAGFAGAAILIGVGVWRIRDDEIPRIALLTAAFFVASSIHVPVGNVTSVHLLLNGLVGVVLGRRAGLAVAVGLLLQVALLQHGGWLTLGINTCIMALPALFAWQLFALCQRLPGMGRPGFRAALVGISVLVWTLSLVYSLVLLATNYSRSLSALDLDWANVVTFHPLTLAGVLALAALAAWWEPRLGNTPEFPLGLLIGELTVLVTTVLNCLVLVGGGQEDWPSLVLVTLVPHLVIAVIEGVVLGFTLGFLVRVKPEMVHWQAAEKAECLVDSVP